MLAFSPSATWIAASSASWCETAKFQNRRAADLVLSWFVPSVKHFCSVHVGTRSLCLQFSVKARQLCFVARSSQQNPAASELQRQTPRVWMHERHEAATMRTQAYMRLIAQLHDHVQEPRMSLTFVFQHVRARSLQVCSLVAEIAAELSGVKSTGHHWTRKDVGSGDDEVCLI